jgi:heme/copper-type cytochrome/quinol oxidase subunit 3
MLEYLIKTAFATSSTPIVNLDKNPSSIVTSQHIFDAISKITDWVFSFFLVVAVLFILVGAWNVLVARGNPEGFQTGKKMLTYAVIAIATAVLAKSIVTVAAAIVGTTVNI